ncbi:unnamed protein product [Diatraea saccharalis]|uniref:Uncharacterized protein n=1 Tax=Diatraea saccharalis TaxID=40085 RepID=A0A9P0G055_9NEOP|nr:unnamed protein product [Diatraea saccharalis]
MGKDEKEDSGFGFKDKAKAEETLRLLEEHPMNYRRLTVRGLLGRAKRVLSMTKAEDKIKNIKEAMEVFENWLAELDKNKEQKTEQKEKTNKKRESEEKNGDEEDSASDVEMEEEQPKKKELPADTVPGLGFKDKDAADGTIKELEGRDPDYQKLAVKGLIGRAKRVLTCTRDETKLANIKEAISIFEKFLDDFDTNHMSKQNNPYISLGHVRTAEKMADGITDQQKSFIAAYVSVNGEYKRLRTVQSSEGGKTWDIVRNVALKDLKEKHAEAKLFDEKEQPTKEHIEMMLWAYSPEPARVKKYVSETKEEKNDSDAKEKEKQDRKRRSSARDRDDESPSKKKKE